MSVSFRKRDINHRPRDGNEVLQEAFVSVVLYNPILELRSTSANRGVILELLPEP